MRESYFTTFILLELLTVILFLISLRTSYWVELRSSNERIRQSLLSQCTMKKEFDSTKSFHCDTFSSLRKKYGEDFIPAWIKLAHITMTTAFVMTCSSLLACAFYAWKAKIVKGTTFCALAGIFGIGVIVSIAGMMVYTINYIGLLENHRNKDSELIFGYSFYVGWSGICSGVFAFLVLSLNCCRKKYEAELPYTISDV